MTTTRLVRRGKQERAEHELRLAIASQQPHRKIARGEHVLDVRLECALGRLNFRGEISGDQYDAGKRYRDIVAAYLVVLESPPDCPPDFPDSVRRKNNYNASFEALARVGQRPAKMVSRVAVWDEDPTDDYAMECLRVGLAALVRHYSAARVERKIIPFSEFRPIA